MDNVLNTAPFNYLLNEGLQENERIFKLSKAVLNDTDELVVQLLINADDYDKFLTDDLKKKVKAIINGIVPEGIRFHVVFRKTETTERYILQNIHEFFLEESSFIYNKIQAAKIEIEINYGTVIIKIGVTPDMYSYLIECKYDEKLALYLESLLMEDVEISLYRTEFDREKGIRKFRTASRVVPKDRVIDVRVNVNFLGMVTRKPIYICDAVKNARENVAVCGEVVEVKELKSKAGKTFFKATISDTTSKVDVLCFPRFPSHIEAVKSYLLEKTECVAEGELKMDERSGNYVMFARKLAQCQIDHASISTEIVYNELPDEYVKIIPQKYLETEQAMLFDEDKPLPDILKGKIVVFDLETTGLNAPQDSIIEIGAVSMVDGVIEETFSTLIDPCRHIPESASAVNHIYDDDLIGAPLFSEVVPDFYLFCNGATLCGHNVNFDIGFLTYHAKKELYNFDNPLIDTLQMAQRLLRRTSHNNLGDLCKEFDIELSNAHRALYDTIATAKLLKKLAYISSK